MKIIALQGKGKTGKSMVLKMFLKKILEKYSIVATEYSLNPISVIGSLSANDLADEMLKENGGATNHTVSFEINGKKIGLTTHGDMLWHVVKSITCLHDCEIVFCACKTKGDTKNYLTKSFKDLTIIVTENITPTNINLSNSFTDYTNKKQIETLWKSLYKSLNVKKRRNCMQAVRDYILRNWKNTFHDPKEMHGGYTVPKPYISPSMGGIYTSDLYYWDVYFINLGLMADGFDGQVENNLDNMAYFIDTLGYMPNASNLTDRSQPPLFCSAVYDYYVHKGDKAIIRKYMPYIKKEYDFWQTQRKTPFGLNNFSTNGDEELKLLHYRGLSDRVLEKRDTREEQLALATDIMAIAESGLDFNMRFRTKRSKIDASAFLHLDLNCFLYEMEAKAAKMLEIVGESPEPFKANAIERKSLIERYFYDEKQGIYLDCNVVDGGFSEIVSAVSAYPYAFGISEDKKGMQKVLNLLEQEYGVTPTPYRGEDVYYQWDYPCAWPAATCLIYKALKTLGLTNDAKRIAQKYMGTIDKDFEKTGRLWEKYDAVRGGMGVSSEYDTPEMMGWTAGVYVYFDEELKRLNK